MYKCQNPQMGKIKNKIKSLKKGAPKENQKIGSQSIPLDKISLGLHEPFYNIENIRTLINVKEYCNDNNEDAKDFKVNISGFDKAYQQKYHGIIYEYALKREEDYSEVFIDEAQDQRYPIYISSEGIIMNGNTRMSYWREKANQVAWTSAGVECYVFPETMSWFELLQAVNALDSGVDLRQEYLWYARAEQVKSLIDSTATTNDLKEFASFGKYANTTEMMNEITKVELAEEFLKQKYPGYSKFSDLDKFGADSGGQVFGTYQKGYDAARKMPGMAGTVLAELKSLTHQFIIDQSKQTDFASAHLGVAQVWDKMHVGEELKKIKKSSAGKNPLQPPKRGSPKKSNKVKKMPKSVYLKKAAKLYNAKKIRKAKKSQKALSIILDKIAEQLKTNRKDLLGSTAKIDIPSAKKSFKVLKSEVQKIDKKLQKM